MPTSLGHRIAKLERVSQYPTEARLFLERAHAYARRTGCSFGTAEEFVAGRVGDQELEVLTEQLERIAFGDDIAARDAAKSETLAQYFLKSDVLQNSNLENAKEDREF